MVIGIGLVSCSTAARLTELGCLGVVVDRAGEVIVAMRADNAGPHTMENARRKAYTARSFRTSTTAYAKRFADNDPVVRQQVTLPNVIAIPGGLPVKLGDEVIAGVGVSGSPGVDEPWSRPGSTKSPNSLNDPIRRRRAVPILSPFAREAQKHDGRQLSAYWRR